MIDNFLFSNLHSGGAYRVVIISCLCARRWKRKLFRRVLSGSFVDCWLAALSLNQRKTAVSWSALLFRMGGMGNPVSDDRVELVDDNVGIRYRLRKCGKTRLVIIAVVVAVLVIGGIVAAAYLLTSKFSYLYKSFIVQPTFRIRLVSCGGLEHLKTCKRGSNRNQRQMQYTGPFRSTLWTLKNIEPVAINRF